LGAKIGVVVLSIVALRVCTSGASKPTATADAPPPVAAAAVVNQRPVAPTPVVSAERVALPPLSAATLLQAYKANEIKADLKYKGKRFHITGTVVGIRSDITDDPVVELVTDLMGVSAQGLSKEFAATLDKGDTMEADCTATGSILGSPEGSPTLDCSRE